MYPDFFDSAKLVAQYDPEVADAMDLELGRQRRNIELIASENFVSPAVMAAMGSVLTNKYAEGYPGKRYYGGCEYVDVVEDLARDRAKELFGDCGYGTLLSFTLKPGGKTAYQVLDALKVTMISTHLGDNRSMTLPVAQTIYAEMAAEQRQKWGISEGLIRVSLGIEHINDLINDWKQALE